jgi:cytidylate kinase
MAIITLSRELGSRGTEIADALAKRLGYAKLDKESLEGLLASLGMKAPSFEKEEERKPGFWQQLTLEKVRYLDFMKAALYAFADQKDCVIVGRGAHLIFRGVPGTLRMRIIAPPKARVECLRERLGVDEQRALRMMHQSDHDRAGYHRYFFNASWDALADYDLVVNTAGITPAETCDMVAALLKSPPFVGVGEQAHGILRDLRIAQEVIIAIAYRERVPIMNLDVVCDRGVVAIDGTVSAETEIARCVGIAGAVKGVQRVVSTIAVVALTYYPGV